MADVSIRVGLDVGGLLANSARGVSAIKEIDRAMEEARKKGDYDLYGKMAYEKDKLQTGISGFQQDVKAFTGSAKYQEYNAAIAKGEDTAGFIADQDFMARLKSLDESNKALEKALNGVREAAEKGDFEQIQRENTAAGREIDRFHQTAGQSAAPDAGKSAKDTALAGFLNVQTAQQIIGAVAGGIKTWVAHLDRSGIIGQQGGGDIVGAEISGLHRSAAEKSSFWGSVGRIGGGILGGAIGTIIAPGVGTAALGSSLLGAGGDLVGTLGDEKKANEMATKEAYARLWQAQAPSAMELAGLLGRYGGSEAENTRAIRASFAAAAGAANEYGYSAQEGMEAVKQGARQGLSESEAVQAAKAAFAFERGTGADRDTLLELETRGRRFGMDNMMSAAWQGNQASGMSTGQFNEFLRSMQRVFEDGISKGFVRGANEIAGNMTFLSTLGGGSELYRGEEGAKVMQTLSSGIEGATSLSSVNDILTYRGAQSVIDRWKKSGDESQRQKYRDLFDLDPSKEGYEAGDPTKASSWYAATLLMSRGFTPEVFNEQMRNFRTADRKNFDNVVGRIMSQYRMNSGQAGFLYNAWENNGGATWADYQRAMTIQSPEAPASGSVELNYEKMTQAFSTTLAKYGQGAFNVKVENMHELTARMEEKIRKDLGLDREPVAEIDILAENNAKLTAGDTVRRITRKMYDEVFGGSEDKNAYNTVNSIFSAGYRSDNEDEFNMAIKFSQMLASMTETERGAIGKYNKNDTWNELGKAVDIRGLITAFENLTKKMDDIQVTVGESQE